MPATLAAPARRSRRRSADLPMPDPRAEPRAFLRALFDAAVAPGPARPAARPLPAAAAARPHARARRRQGGRRDGRGARGALAADAPIERPGRHALRLCAARLRRRGRRAARARIEVVEAAHPVPDEAGRRAAARILELAHGLRPDDLVICLMSGGASSLLALPAPTASRFADKQAINDALLEERRGDRRDELRAGSTSRRSRAGASRPPARRRASSRCS